MSFCPRPVREGILNPGDSHPVLRISSEIPCGAVGLRMTTGIQIHRHHIKTNSLRIGIDAVPVHIIIRAAADPFLFGFRDCLPGNPASRSVPRLYLNKEKRGTFRSVLCFRFFLRSSAGLRHNIDLCLAHPVISLQNANAILLKKPRRLILKKMPLEAMILYFPVNL